MFESTCLRCATIGEVLKIDDFLDGIVECIDVISGSCAPGRLSCPSMDLENATGVLGLRSNDAGVEFFTEVLPLPKMARDELTSTDQYSRIRLTGPCLRQTCGHWKEGCSLGWAIASTIRNKFSHPDNYEVECAIKNDCRWIAENGTHACEACSSVLNAPFSHARGYA